MTERAHDLGMLQRFGGSGGARGLEFVDSITIDFADGLMDSIFIL